jgi:NAD(P)-dependent dehydrogenase (short-subunit alcohol dehydrogenase family)
MTALRPRDPVVLIAGATGVVGRAAARSFAADGARLALGGTNADRLGALAAELELPDERWVPAVGNVATAEGARSAAAATLQRFGRIDVLLHLVGGWAGGTPLVDVELDDVRAMLDQHVWSTVHLAQAVVPAMVSAGWGRIVVASSFTAVTAPAKSGHYAAAKAAQETLVRSLAKEVAAAGVTVNVVAMWRALNGGRPETRI